jgi:hypothetical protein
MKKTVLLTVIITDHPFIHGLLIPYTQSKYFCYMGKKGYFEILLAIKKFASMARKFKP